MVIDQQSMAPESPYLVVQPEMAFWVETNRSATWSVTLQSYYDRVLEGAHCYDPYGNHWTIQAVHLETRPSLIRRLFLSHREVRVRVECSPPRSANVDEIISRIESVLCSQSDFNAFLVATPAKLLERFRNAATPREIIEIAVQCESKRP